jgi:hypothetical protein
MLQPSDLITIIEALIEKTCSEDTLLRIAPSYRSRLI